MDNTRVQWPPNEVIRSLDDLHELQGLVSSNMRKRVNLDENGWLGRLLIIRSCGHIEVVTAECLMAFFERHTNPAIHNYISENYVGWKSPNAQRLKMVMKALSPEYLEDLESFLTQDYQGTLISNWLGQLISARAKIAHGKNTNETVQRSVDLCTFAILFGQWYIDYFSPLGKADSHL